MRRKPGGLARGYLYHKATSVPVELESDQIHDLAYALEMREGTCEPGVAQFWNNNALQGGFHFATRIRLHAPGRCGRLTRPHPPKNRA
jgi:hypothetical protein